MPPVILCSVLQEEMVPLVYQAAVAVVVVVELEDSAEVQTTQAAVVVVVVAVATEEMAEPVEPVAEVRLRYFFGITVLAEMLLIAR